MSLKDSGDKKLLKVGPFGSESGGHSFDDGGHSTVQQLMISHCGNVHSIQIEYNDNGSSFWSDKHGHNTIIEEQSYIDTIKIDYQYEYLISVHGNHLDSWWFPTYVCSLTFRTNKKCYGPYGCREHMGKYFSIQAPGNMIVGFHSRAFKYIDIRAIGDYLKPVDVRKYNSDVVPAIPNPPRPPRPARYPLQTNLRNRHEDDEGNNQASYIVAGNQVNGNEGNQNGGFVVGNTYRINLQFTP